MLDPSILRPLWYRAVMARVGISIRTNDRRWLVNNLYHTRTALGDPKLGDLTIQLPPKPKQNEVWICRKDIEFTRFEANELEIMEDPT